MHRRLSVSAKAIKWLAIASMIIAVMFMLPSCGSTEKADSGSTSNGGGAEIDVPFANKEPVDLTVYESMEDYDGESRLVETDVAEVVKLINDKETFVVFFGFAKCPFCNAIISYINRAAEEAGQYIGYVDTRKDPSWTNNMEIDNYDLVVKYFGDYLKKDEDGKEHLYTPDMYFIKNGEIVARHDGAVEGVDDPFKPLSSAQEEELMKSLAEDFDKLK